MNHKTTIGNKEVYASRKQIETLAIMGVLRKGGFATVKGYIPTSGYLTSPKVDITFISRFSLENLYKRKIKEIEKINFDELTIGDFTSQDKYAKMTPKEFAKIYPVLETIFNDRKEQEIGSMQKTLMGVRDDAYRLAHDECYAVSAQGVKVHLVTEKNAQGLKRPVLTEDGFPTVDSIMVGMIETYRVYQQKGERKKVNSGDSKLMGNIISKKINSRSVSYKSLSLKENFDSLSMGGEEFTIDDIIDQLVGTVTIEDPAELEEILNVTEEEETTV